MYVTKKITKKAVIIFSLAAALILTVAFCVLSCTTPAQTTAVSDIGVYELKASTNEERIAFLEQFGWQVESEPNEVTSVTIPRSFNKVYSRYNKIQLDQGLDLLGYAGKECGKITYTVTNYPDTQQPVIANLLVYNGNVIGGDISSAALNGFMHGFALDGFTKELK